MLEQELFGTTPLGKPRLFVCLVCTRAFARQEHLKRHERAHTREKPFDCGVCFRKFLRRDLLLRHAQKLHAGCLDDAIRRLRRRRGSTGKLDDQKPPRAADNYNQLASIRRAQLEQQLLPIYTSGSLLYTPTRTVLDGAATHQQLEQLRSLRRASFLAALGPNYAMPPNMELVYPETVEFSTPQLAPAEEPWQMNVDLLPDLALLNDKGQAAQPLLLRNQSHVLVQQVVEKESPKTQTGYSFYDMPQLFDNLYSSELLKQYPTYNHTLLPVKDEDLLPEQQAAVAEPNVNEILSDLNNARQIYLNGYSFYLDNNQSSSSTNATILPLQLEKEQAEGTTAPITMGYSKTRLFTHNLRGIVYAVLAKYPYVGYPSPHIPTNEKMEQYRTTFINLFLNHYPLMHPALLNEHEMMQFARPDAPNEELSAAYICLPLLVGLLGAAISNEKTDASNLFEALRRCVHVFLESRKGTPRAKDSNPLWLIQALTLLVIYSMFADGDVNLPAVLRQINALGALLKLSAGTIDDQLAFDKEPPANVRLLFPQAPASGALELAYTNALKRQLRPRTVLTIYNLIMLLAQWYNIPPRLAASDLVSVCLPSRSEESVWCCYDYAAYQRFRTENPTPLPASPTTSFMDTLYMLINDDLNRPEFLQASNFGVLCLVHGIYDQFALSQTAANIAVSFETCLSSLLRLAARTAKNTVVYPGLVPGAPETHVDADPSSVASVTPPEHEPRLEVVPVNILNLDAQLLLDFLAIKVQFNINSMKEKVLFSVTDLLGQMFADVPNLTDEAMVKVARACIGILKRTLFDEDALLAPENGLAVDEYLLGFTALLALQTLFDVFLAIAKIVMRMERSGRAEGQAGVLGGASEHQHDSFEGDLSHLFSHRPAERTGEPMDSELEAHCATLMRICDALEVFLRKRGDYSETASLMTPLASNQLGGNVSPAVQRVLRIGESVFRFFYVSKFKFVCLEHIAESVKELRRQIIQVGQ